MDWLAELLKEFPSLSVAKERLQYWQDKYNTLESENDRLRRENEQLDKDNAKLKSQVETLQTSEGFVESEGVLWKRKPNGEYEKNPYCPICKLVMSPSPPMVPIHISCLKCSFTAPFRPDKVEAIMNELPQ